MNMNATALLLRLRLEAERIGMTATSKKAGIEVSNLYKAIDEGANPTLDTLLKVASAVGLELYWRAM